MQNISQNDEQNPQSFLNLLREIRSFSKEYIVPFCVLISFFNNIIILIILYRSKAVQQSLLVCVRWFYLAFAWSDIATVVFYQAYRYARMSIKIIEIFENFSFSFR